MNAGGHKGLLRGKWKVSALGRPDKSNSYHLREIEIKKGKKYWGGVENSHRPGDYCLRGFNVLDQTRLPS